MKQTATHKPSFAAIVLKYLVPLAVSAGLCWLLFHDFDFDTMVQLIRSECRPWWIVAGMALTGAAHVARALRWRIQLRALDIDVPLFTLVISIFGTYAVNLVLPRLGEIWRVGYIARRGQASFATVLGSMVADRLADTLSVLAIAMVALLLAGHHILEYMRLTGGTAMAVAGALASPWLWAGVAAVAAGVWWVLTYRREWRWVERTRGVAARLWQGFAVVVTMPGKGRWLLYTLAIWGCFFAAMYVEFFSFPFTAGVALGAGPVAVLVTFVLSSLSMGVPSNGGIGPWQWAVMFALGLYALPSIEAAAFANLVMGATVIFNILLGFFTFSVIALGRRGHRRAITTNR